MLWHQVCFSFDGGAEGARTLYLLLAKQALSQVSYSPKGNSSSIINSFFIKSNYYFFLSSVPQTENRFPLSFSFHSR